ncbi:MAG: phosphoribosylpyrophosphate synthetase [Bdellovibrionota bacterium]|nr:phosphoribosylpyrophosphate synthetase [Pseudobdellovibrionaceae bacterium]|tara:strand:+ start:17665 stop:17952 length:288 start_codon:yes stop_codon:yes gene_type:complete
MKTMIETLQQLKKEGFTENLMVRSGNLMNSSRTLLPEDHLELVETHRIESDSDPMHQSILYAIRCKNPDMKGVLINSYGSYSDKETNQFVEKNFE